MPAIDKCHDQFVHALEKEAWDVDKTPLVLPVTANRRLLIDIVARRLHDLVVQLIIIVELKCFSDRKTELNELYIAIGQYLVYRSKLREKGIDIPLYLAVPKHAYDGIFQQLGMSIVNEFGIKMIVVDMENEVIEQWLE